ncbi:lysozyme inhibitor LprI family protein [Mangrovicella endophytica]|uniref:lysozyme inhibitor LprI family protein n=1 Tax=Mangrovicella endophytica TaxID=2066697 RepID=UPI0012FFD921|nr:lysozyme inhibitor LprI family protein [Mangrovicella endophytica]
MRELVLIIAAACLVVSGDAALAAESDAAKTLATVRQCLETAADDPRSCIGIVSNPCQDEPDGSSTQGVDACLGSETEAWDVLLNERYATTLETAKEIDADRKAADDESAVAADDLVKAQRAWIAYRDAECDRLYEVAKDGTIRTNVASACQLEMTATRAIDLGDDQY